MNSKISKIDIARIQIEGACEHHLSGDFILSLTLSGSADSLTCELNEAKGSKFWQKLSIRCTRRVKELYGHGTLSTQNILKERNRARNLIKHHNAGDPEEIEIDLEFESILTIRHAIENYEDLSEYPTKIMEVFREPTKNYGRS